MVATGPSAVENPHALMNEHWEKKMIRLTRLALGAGIMAACAVPASAGEITGNGQLLEVHGKSSCAFSGLNDTPFGDEATQDPGGRVQSYGFFKSQTALGPFLDPSLNDPREESLSPGWACNPNRGGPYVPGS